MNFVDVVRRLRANPCAYLDNCCASSLRMFLVGYKTVDCGAVGAIKKLSDIFAGRESFDPCTRVYLLYADGAAGVMAVLDALENVAAAGLESSGDESFTERVFLDAVRGPILRGKPGMVLGDPTVSSLYNYARGFMSGLEVVAPVEASRQIRELAEFERRLQEWYQVPGAPWHKLIRVHEGPCEQGLKRFVELWDKFAETPLA